MAITTGVLSPPFSLTAGYGGTLSDPDGTNQVSPGGNASALNVTAAAVIKASPGRICTIVVLGVVGSGGAFTINDCATTGTAATANQVYTTVGTIAVGTVITLNFPMAVGIVVSAVPTGGTPVFAISFH